MFTSIAAPSSSILRPSSLLFPLSFDPSSTENACEYKHGAEPGATQCTRVRTTIASYVITERTVSIELRLESKEKNSGSAASFLPLSGRFQDECSAAVVIKRRGVISTRERSEIGPASRIEREEKFRGRAAGFR